MIYAFMNQKGGVGKTTLAVSFAARVHESNSSVCLIDADGQASSSKWVERAREGAFAQSFSFALERHTQPDDMADAAVHARQEYDYVVCDSAGGTSDIPRTLCLVADVVVLPTGPHRLELESTVQTLRLLRQAQRARQGSLPAVIVVLNGRGDEREHLTRDAQEFIRGLGVPSCGTSIRSRNVVADSAGQDCAVWHLGANSTAAHEVINVIEEIDRYGKATEEELQRGPTTRTAAIHG